MVYDADNEIQTVVADIKNERGDLIRITKIDKGSGAVYIDIRNMHTDDGEIRPTTEGIQLDAELATEVIIEVVKALGENTMEAVFFKLKTDKQVIWYVWKLLKSYLKK